MPERVEQSLLHQQAKNNKRCRTRASRRGNIAGLDVSLDGSVSEVHSEEAIFDIIIAVLLKSQSNK